MNECVPDVSELKFGSQRHHRGNTSLCHVGNVGLFKSSFHSPAHLELFISAQIFWKMVSWGTGETPGLELRWQRDGFLSAWKDRQIGELAVDSREATMGPRCKSQKAPSRFVACFRKRVCVWKAVWAEGAWRAWPGQLRNKENNISAADVTQKVEKMIVLNFYHRSW